MRRILLIALVLVIVAGAFLWWNGSLPTDWLESKPLPETSRFDTDADGQVELVAYRLGDRATIWRWDRQPDGKLDAVAYDATTGPEGELRRTSSITAWDYGADGILDSGDVPEALEELLRDPDIATAMEAPQGDDLSLVEPRIRQLVDRFRQGFDDWRLSGFRLPIVGARLPDQDNLLPGARRSYRNGTHQGFDMYGGHVGAPTGYGGPVVAANEGEVVRADVDYEEMTSEEHDALLEEARSASTTPSEILDRLRGRQVWIDHGHGVVTRYCHLSRIAQGVDVGANVEGGDVIGFVGNSGMEAGIRGNRADAHLHFELWIDDRYLGEGMTPEQVRARAREIFDLADPEGGDASGDDPTGDGEGPDAAGETPPGVASRR